jgi:hypothetical protein
MGRIYSAQFTGQAVTVSADLFELTAPSTRLVCIHGIVLGQYTDVGDAAEEILSILFKRGTAATTSGSTPGSSPTPIPLEHGQGAAGSTVECYNSTKMSGGTIETVHADTWNVRGQFIWLPTPEMRPWLAVSERFTVEAATAPADSLTMNGTLFFEEVG